MTPTTEPTTVTPTTDCGDFPADHWSPDNVVRRVSADIARAWRRRDPHNIFAHEAVLRPYHWEALDEIVFRLQADLIAAVRADLHPDDHGVLDDLIAGTIDHTEAHDRLHALEWGRPIAERRSGGQRFGCIRPRGSGSWQGTKQAFGWALKYPGVIAALDRLALSAH